MKVTSIKTRKVKPRDALTDFLDQYLLEIPEKSIIAITSKIISLCQGRLIPQSSIDKKTLIQQESDAYLEDESPYDLLITIKENQLIPSAGIDESNAKDAYILYPKNIQKTAVDIWQHLKNKQKLKAFGLLITDSCTTPLRRGVTGRALAWCGFSPLYSYIGKPDIYGKDLKVSQINIIDALATTAVFMMGEGAEQTPIALIENAPKIQFSSKPPSKEILESIQISLEEDIYGPLLKKGDWIKKSN
jgi:dihydrofolate synthase / folylpolyglutamate synthase